ncbi:DUF2155 domain-containing protein [Erythrobacter sp. WH131]|uniref:DUF2155 domain-containing protein n=2 Tax=Erythrobacter ani TaxID=2827235 RepID=A0ABS6SKC1_9SPHN|nr:DUF2155 domain-containing protein [Erythrobacter ani]
MRASYPFLPFCIALALAGCGGEAEEPDTVVVPIEQEEAAQPDTPDDVDAALSSNTGATPMAERVATIGLLNKRNNVTQDFEMRPGETVEEGPVILTLAACERTAPWEMPKETGAFVQVDIQNRRDTDHTRVFSGWLFKESPSLNVVEHPIYDVWVKDCAMSFPGDE